MRRIWAGLLIGGAAAAAAASLWAMQGQVQPAPAAPSASLAPAALARNPTVFVGGGSAGQEEAAVSLTEPTIATAAVPAPSPPVTPPQFQARPLAPPPVQAQTRPPPPPALAAAAPPPSRPTALERSAALEGAPPSAGHGHCPAPSAPAIPSASAVPSEAQLASFAAALERFDAESAGYRGCLDAVFNDLSQPETARRSALTAANANALQSGSLWDAYEAATQRYRRSLDSAAEPAAP